MPVVSNFYLGLPEVQQVAGRHAAGAAFVQVKSEKSAIEFSCFTALSAGIQAVSGIKGAIDTESVYNSLLNLKEVNVAGQVIPIINREAKIPINIKTLQ